jgi:putative inorganic carbon (HCO3(-)) transporter
MKTARCASKKEFFRPWVLALVLCISIPAFPDYIAPLLAGGAFLLARRDARQHHRPMTFGTTAKPLILFLLYMCIGVLYAKTPLMSFGTVLMWVVMFLVYVSITTVVTTPSRLETALFSITLVTGLIGLIGTLQYLLRMAGVSVSFQFWEWIDRAVYEIFPFSVNLNVTGNRACATFANPNVLGEYLVIALPFVIYYSFCIARDRWRLFSRLCLLTSVTALIFTFSRGSYLGALVVVLIFGIANIKSLQPMVLGGISALLLMPDSVWSRLLVTRSMDKAVTERLDVWEISANLIAQDPLFGSGPGVQYIWNVLSANSIAAPHAHNLILQLLIEGGAVGLCLMLFIGWQLVRHVLEMIALPHARQTGVMIAAVTAGFCVNAMVEYPFLTPKLIGVFMMMLALADVMGRQLLARPSYLLTDVLPFGSFLQKRKEDRIACMRR